MPQPCPQLPLRSALVTGASSGIGYEIAILLARQQCDLVLVGRNRAALTQLSEHVRSAFGVQTLVCAADLSKRSAPADVFDHLQQSRIELDVLVNNAGFAMQGLYAENDLPALLDMLQVNITTVTHLTRLILPGMIRRGRGRILNIASIGAFMPGPLTAAYFASKAYVLSLSQALANELRGTGVTVTALCPGPTRTRFAARAGLTDTRAFGGALLEPAAVAREGIDAMTRGRTVVIPGLKHRLQMLPTSLVPRPVLAFFSRKYHETRSGNESRCIAQPRHSI